jgi:Rad3-related DNA helicase
MLYFTLSKLNNVQEKYIFDIQDACAIERTLFIKAYTGTGKTYGTSYGVAAGIHQRQSTPQIMKQYQMWDNGAMVTCAMPLPLKERIVYVTRTIHQAVQILKAIKTNPAYSFISAIKVHKKHMCAMDGTSAMDYSTFDRDCDRLTYSWLDQADINSWNLSHPSDPRRYQERCKYWLGFGRDGEPPERGKEMKHDICKEMAKRTPHHAMARFDIEDMISYGKTNMKCPHILAKAARTGTCNFLVQTYQYMDIKHNRASGKLKDFQGHHIMDEGHNLASAIMELTQCKIDPKDLITLERLYTDSNLPIERPPGFDALKNFYVYLCASLRHRVEYNEIGKASRKNERKPTSHKSFKEKPKIQSTLNEALPGLNLGPIKPKVEKMKKVNISDEAATTGDVLDVFVSLDKALEGFGMDCVIFQTILQQCYESQLDALEKGIVLPELGEAGRLGSYMERFQSHKEHHSSYYAYTLVEDRCNNQISLFGGMDVFGLRPIYFICIDSQKAFSRLSRILNNVIVCSGSYDDKRMAGYTLCPSYNSITQDNKSFFLDVPEHVITNPSNVMFIPMCYPYTRRDKPQKMEFSYYGMKDNKGEEAMAEVGVIVEQFMLVTSKNILIFVQSKKRCKQLSEILRTRKDRNVMWDESNVELADYAEKSKDNKSLSWWKRVQIHEDNVNLTHPQLVELLTFNGQRKIIISYARSTIAEGIDTPSSSISFLLVVGVPWENIGSITMRMMEDYYTHLLNPSDENISCVSSLPMEIAKTNASNALVQSIGRSVRGGDSKIVIGALDWRLTDQNQPDWRYFLPNWFISRYVTLCGTPLNKLEYDRILLDIFKKGF